ncbi:MAG: hypothetical protein Roseis2KO_14080 [Roseivirga sp.]
MNSFSNTSLSRFVLLILCGLLTSQLLQAQLTTGEYFFDTDPGVSKAIHFSIPEEFFLDGEFTFDTQGLEPGTHLLGLRVKTDDLWGFTETIEFYVAPATIDETNRGFLKAEYFIDTDPGVGLATTFDLEASDFTEDDLDIGLSNLSPGDHIVGVRYQNADKVWSFTEVSAFTIEPENGVDQDYLIEVSYSVYNSAGALMKTGSSMVENRPSSIDMDLDIDINGLAEGDYVLETYVKNETGLRGHDQSILFSVIDGNAPATISLSNSEIEENQPIGTVVGNFSTEDIDEDETHTYTLVAGDGDEDNAAFTIDGDELKTAAIFDFATKSSYAIRVRSTDLGELFTEQTFTVTVIDAKEDQTITFTEIGIDTYGETETLVATSSSGLDVTFESSDPVIATATGNELKFIGVGEVIISAIQAGDDTYGAEEVTQTIQVSKASLTVTAEDKTKAYGAENPELTTTYSGFVNEDDINSLTQLPEIATSALATSGAGDYDITLSGGESDNYTFSFTNGVLVVTKAMLTVTADNQTRVYGAANPELTFSYTGFVNGEDENDLATAPEISTIATNASDVGSYTITLTASEDSNYAYELVEGVLSITKAVLIAEANDATRNKGEDNPAFSITYSGFVNGDDVSDLDAVPNIATNASSESDRGTYDIVPSGGADNNYSFDFRNGTLTVTGPVFALPSSIDFGQVNSGESATESVVIENTGDGLLQVSAISLPPGFTADQNTFDLAVSESINLTITFSPTEGRVYNGNLVLSSNDGTSLIALTGEGMLVTGLDDEILDAEEVKTYPNPVNNELTIDLTAGPAGLVDLRLLDLNGRERLVLRDVRERKVTLDVSSYRMGIYMLKIESRKGTVFRKVMIER